MQNSETLYGTDRVLADVHRERKRQVVVEGFSRGIDDKYPAGRLALAAAAYALSWANVKQIEAESGEAVARETLAEAGPHEFWPMDPRWWKPHNDRHDLVRAAALLVAEIERIDRAADSHPRREQLTALDDQLDRDGDRVERAGRGRMVRSGCVVRAGIQDEAGQVVQRSPADSSGAYAGSGLVSAPAVESSPPDCPADSGSCGGGE